MYPELADARRAWRWSPADDALRDRVLLVTGAGAGIGRAAARTFAHFGANVVLLGRTVGKLESLYDAIRGETGTDPTIVPCDLEATGADEFQTLCESIVGHYGRLDGILHNASRLGPRVPLEHYDANEWRRVLRVNLDAPVVLTAALLPALRRAATPTVAFTSSSVGRAPRAYWGAYAVSKAGIEAAAEMFAEEHEHEGIRFVTINPGATRTAMRAAAYPGEDPSTVPAPEARLDLYVRLFAADAPPPARRLDARDWLPT
jgi:NAD(P)-dependent dehydrogenase (short-subunit alcohol dehydrogenase family)